MAVTNLQVLDIIEVMEVFLERKRPPEHIRPKLDIRYKIEGQRLSQMFKEDQRIFVAASSMAQKAADYILDRHLEPAISG